MSNQSTSKIILIILGVLFVCILCSCTVGGVLYFIKNDNTRFKENVPYLGENLINKENGTNEKENQEEDTQDEDVFDTNEDLEYLDDYSIPLSKSFIQKVERRTNVIGEKIGFEDGELIYGPIGGNPDVFNYALYIPTSYYLNKTNDFGVTYYAYDNSISEAGVIMFPEGEPEADDYSSCEGIVFSLFPEKADMILILSTKDVYVDGQKFERVIYTIYEDDDTITYGVDQCASINGNVYDAFVLLNGEDRYNYEKYAEAILDNMMFEQIEVY